MAKKNQSMMYAISDEDFIKLVMESDSIINVLYKLGYTNGRAAHTYQIFHRRCSELGIDKSFNGTTNSLGVGLNTKYSLEDIFKKNSTYKNMSSLKKRLVREGLLDYKCAICGNSGYWQDKPLSLHIDHINGINNDNRLDNLRFLCPNCHSQTVTYCGRNLTTNK